MTELEQKLKARAVRELRPTHVTGGLPVITCVCGGYFDPNYCIACGCERGA